LFAYYPSDATVIPKTPSLSSLKSILVLIFCYQHTPVVLSKRALNWCFIICTRVQSQLVFKWHYSQQTCWIQQQRMLNAVADPTKV